MEARRSDLPTAICSGSQVSRGGKPVGEGVRAGWKCPWKGQSAPKTAIPNAPCYLRTNERSEQGRDARNQDLPPQLCTHAASARVRRALSVCSTARHARAAWRASWACTAWNRGPTARRARATASGSAAAATRRSSPCQTGAPGAARTRQRHTRPRTMRCKARAARPCRSRPERS